MNKEMIDDIVEQERLVIGAVVNSPELFDEVELTPQDFFSTENKIHWQCVESMIAGGEHLNVFSCKEKFKIETGTSGQDYFMDMSHGALGHTDLAVKQYADRIKKQSHITKAMQIFSNSIDMLNDGNLDGIDNAVSKLMDINRKEADYDHSFGDVACAVVDEAEKAMSEDGAAMTTGYKQLDDAMGGFFDSDLIIIPARPAMGKDQPLHSKILLEDGSFTTMGNIKIGDKLASVDGGESKVTAIYPQGVKKVYKLKLRDGREVECGGEHLWRVKSCRFYDNERTLTTLDIMKKISMNNYRGRIQLVGHDGVFGVDGRNINPWLLGAMIGDGCMAGEKFGFTNSEPDVIEKFKNCLSCDYDLVKQHGKYDYRVNYKKEKLKNPLKDRFKDAGLLGKKSPQKFIPEFAFTETKEYRCQLIAGLIETDGWVEKTGSVNFSSSSKELSLGLKGLIESVGGSAMYRVKSNVKYTYKGEILDGLNAHVLSIALPESAMRFTTARILKNLKKRHLAVEPSIESIVEVGEFETQCITVSHDSHLYITDNYCVTHNTAVMLNTILRCGGTPGVISAEQGREQMGIRSVCIGGKINHHKFRTGQLEEEDWTNMTASIMKFKERNGRIYDKPAPTMLEIEKIARRWVYKNGVDILFIDYAQRISHEDKRMPRWQQNTDIAMRLKELARTLNIPVVALAQVNRDCEKRPDKRPEMGDIADASAYEKEADAIITLYRDEVYNEDTPDRGVLEMDFKKNRHGPTGVIRMKWEGQYMRVDDFTDYEQRHPEPIAYQSQGFIPQ